MKLNRATRQQVINLQKLLESCPGNYEVVLQFADAINQDPIVLVHRVSPSDEFLSQARRTLTDAQIDVIAHDLVFGTSSQMEEPAAVVAR